MSVKTHNKTKLVPVNRSVALLPERDASISPILECIDLGVTFGGLKAVDNFDITIGRTEIAGLIGPNGAGKTTIFNLLTGVYQPTRGSVLVNGIDIKGMPVHKVNRLGIARTFQNIRLFTDMSVLDNVKVGLHNEIKCSFLSSTLHLPGYYKAEKKANEKAMELLEFMGLSEFADHKAGSLPYGSQRRLEIVRALATNPSVILLDEPAAGMNPSETTELMHQIRRIRDTFHVAIFLIEHDMNLVMNVCEAIAVVNYGRIIAKGTPEEIRTNPAVIEAYLGKEDGESHAEN